jgi:hypothetical protein
MKKVFVLFVFSLIVTGAVSAQISRGGTAWVSSKTAAVKSSTWFFAGTKGTLQMGAQVSVLQVNGKWAEVRSAANSSLSGWTQVGNLSARRIVSTGSGASASEVALAGKGFNQEVENAYKTDGALNYADVDKTEALTVSQDDLFKFVTEGHLVTGEQQ